jgi:hypothetical protein
MAKLDTTDSQETQLFKYTVPQGEATQIDVKLNDVQTAVCYDRLVFYDRSFNIAEFLLNKYKFK